MYFYPLVQYVVTQTGLQRGHGVRGAPYDFRLAVSNAPLFLANLTALIEETYAFNSNRSVVLLAHSMGCVYTLYFLNQVNPAWVTKYIKAFVPISGVWEGAVLMLQTLISGYNELIPFVRDISVRPAQRGFQSSYWLMPTPGKLWNATTPVVITASRNYSAYDYDALFEDMNYPLGPIQRSLTANLTSGQQPPTVVPTFCLHGADMPTADTLG